MQVIIMSKEELRKFLVVYQGLYTNNTFVGEKGIKECIRRVGCIQYDPLNVVGRNADLVIQSRIENYDPAMMDDLLYKKRELIDGWDKMMSIYSVNDWPYFKRVRSERKKEIESVLKHRNSFDAINYIDTVKEFIQKNGATIPSKIDLGSVEKGIWGHGKLSSAAMDYLWNSGELGVKEKKNTQKKYDLIERLLPEEIVYMPDPFKNDDEFYKWYIKRRVGSIGAYWDKTGEGWLGNFIYKRDLRQRILNELVEDGELILIKVETMKETFYLRKEDMSIVNESTFVNESNVRFLAPLDNIIWDRKLTREIFNFDYIWEVYKPVDKRKYGYYVLPVLYGDKIVARFEPELHRGNGPLTIKNWWWEESFKVTDDCIDSVIEALDRFCKYLKADGISEDSFRKIDKRLSR
ncbi:crosslink repair DNA glycosylase YcaQ family protein [Clostridium sp. AL.422]|uniref:winged helix-turn-helix domain-containing protein n=1 Tax=Clostridium TaxID=1485 RepID=UPI00293DC841|nr:MULTISPECIES: crosslink repair DNA glycosylase YcaQ family protein [unclassified Clostridium]MDV4152569.1 crosslink repair DNA glycosylase YcaQ family protein [Clostridium sp. AL.422]